MQLADSEQPRELERALEQVARADRRLATVADDSFRRARSATLAGALTIGIGAALVGTLAGPSLRRRLVTGTLGMALPFLASVVAEVARELAKTRTYEGKAE